jgi:hypothetical protein
MKIGGSLRRLFRRLVKRTMVLVQWLQIDGSSN